MLTVDPIFKLYAICSCVLTMQMLFLGGLTAGTRARHKGYMNPEDDKVSFGDARLIEGAEHPDVARVQRAHRNLLESLPMFFALGLLCALTQVSPLGGQICIGVFTAARLAHSVAYLKGLQPWRTLFYAIGALSLVGMVVQILMRVLA